MKLFSNTAPSQDLGIRGRLLQRTLLQYCSSNRQTTFTEVMYLQDGEAPVSLLESLSAFPKPKNAAMAFFDGLVNAPEAHLGRNVLVCTQPLQAELAMFAARNGVDSTLSPMWWRNVLRNFERVILLDRYALAQSVGFAPWARLSLADHFPVILAPPNQRNAAQVLILNHDPVAGAKEILEIYDRLSSQCTVSVCAVDSLGAVVPDAMTSAAIHIHYGYDNHVSPAGLTPFDSLANGVYTAILPTLLKANLRKSTPLATPLRQEVDARIIKEAKARSYALLADNLDELQTFVGRALYRLSMFAHEKLAINPELQRFDRMNEEYISNMLGRFTKQVPA